MYLIGSGYIGGPDREQFAKVWLKNLDSNPDVNPRKIAIICSRSERPPVHCCITDYIVCKGDLGHINDGHSDRQKCVHPIEGWSASMLAAAWIAYNDVCDFIFVEQDCLPFGPFITKMYEELGDAMCIFGSVSIQPAAQSLFLVRHGYIPEFTKRYLDCRLEHKVSTGEESFAMMERDHPEKFRRLSFGFDRDRPPKGFAPMKDKVFYVQQVSVDEVRQLRECGILT